MYHQIKTLRQYSTTCKKIELDDILRTSFILECTDICLTGRNIHYPNCLLERNGELIAPYDERVMSLQKDTFYDDNIWNEYVPYSRTLVEQTPVYFFIYNVDNYYHFIYDTLPQLVGYFKLKEIIPSLTLLVNTSHPLKNKLSPFVAEFLNNLGITEFLIASKTTKYARLFIQSSLTHGGQSNDPASKLATSIWKRMSVPDIQTPKRFYISRRTWMHGKTENLGTNYTTRRKCMNEDAVVELLSKYGIQEVFTELLTTDEKLAYFKNAELVVGVSGGGLCNVLFSPSSTKTLCINTPYFLEINKRFKHSIDHVKVLYSNSAEHADKSSKYQLYSRVKITNAENESYGCIGEIEGINGDTYTIRLSSNDVAGFSQDFSLPLKNFYESELQPIDMGLNSPYIIDLKKLEIDLKSIMD